MTLDVRTQLQTTLGTAYTIERELGGGGMSRVFVATDTRLGRRVVVKVLSPDLVASVSADRFEREVRLAARLQHPHIVPLLSAGDVDVAIAWGPIAGYYAKRVTATPLQVVPLLSEPGVKFDYAIAMGVRYGEPEWKATVEKLIVENQAGIDAILREYGVPLVDEHGQPLAPQASRP